MQVLGRLPLHFGDVDAFLGHFIKGRKLTQLGDDLDHLVNDVVDFLLRVEPAEPEADRSVRQVFSDAQRLQHVAGFQSRRGAGRTARYCNIVDAHQKGFALDIREAHIQVVRKAMLKRTVDIDLIELGLQALFETVAKGRQPGTLLLHLLMTKFAGFAKADNTRHVEGTGTHTALVTSAIDDGRELHAGIATTDVESTDAFGPVNLVSADRQEVDVVFLNVDRDLAHGLHAIHGEENAVFFGDFADLGDGIDYANFVVGVHDGDQDSGRPDG